MVQDKVKIDVTPISGYQPELQRKLDGYILHFLKELPPWCILGLLVVVFLVYFNISAADFIPRIIDGLVGGLLTSLVGAANSSRAPRTTTPQTDIKAQNIERANTDSGDVIVSPGTEVIEPTKEGIENE